MQEEVQHMFSLSKSFFSLSKEEKGQYKFNLVRADSSLGPGVGKAARKFLAFYFCHKPTLFAMLTI